MKHSRFLKVAGLLAMVSFFGCGIVSAEIAVGPLTKTVQVAPGKRETVIYKIANQGKEAVTINISARTWFRLPENVDIKIEHWLNLGTDKITLAPKQEKKLKFKVAVPKEAKGELAAMIYFTPERKKEQTIGTSYGVSLYVFVKGTEIVTPAIGKVSISKREGSFYLAVDIENKGNVHFRPKVNAVVKAGKEFEEELVLPFGKPIFGGQSYTFVQKFEKQLSPEGSCTIDVFCNYGDSEEAIVKKSASLDLGEIKEGP